MPIQYDASSNMAVLVYRSKLCSREFPAETLPLKRRVEWFSQPDGRKIGTATQHVTLRAIRPSQQNEPPHPTAMEVRRNITFCLPTHGCFPSMPRTTSLQHGSRKR
ncbi:hypothetical protein CHARACLAT_014796 [Characodon lateralis]|uniref:Uncharacterized protein n=1 Tax=Characodon lateralis TaxID=208331 RepID=A0ABU7DR71_9TELE|nr:hypothetical protein [Characodon lateralis]